MANHAISTSNLYPMPEPKPGHRFVPAKVGPTDDTSVIVLVEDPVWCVEDHLGESVRELSDLMHRGENAALYVPTFGFGAYPIQMHAWVEADPVAKEPEFRAAHVTLQDAGGGSFCHLTAEMAEKLADDAIGFASELRQHARTVRQANHTAADSDVDMDEALRQVRADGAA